MDMNFESMLQRLTEFIRNEAKTETVVGEAFQLGEFQCVPVIRLGMGFGSGGGSGDSTKAGKGEGGGAGAGMGIDPIGFLVTRNGEITFISTHQNKGLAAIFDKVPEILDRWATKKEPVNA